MFSLLTLSTKNSLGGGTETNISATNRLPPEFTSEGLNLKYFLGEHTSRPKKCASHD